MYTVFTRDGIDYFSDLPTLHNYITVDTKAFLANPDYMMAMYNMAKTMFEGHPGEDPECHAAKLLEVILLQCKGHNIDQVIPVFVELVFSRLTKEIKTSELRAMLLQVIIAAMYYKPELLLATLEKTQMPGGTGSVTAHFIQQWIHDTDCFIGLHDRKICVLGLCHLMQMPQQPAVVTHAQKIIPSLLLLFDGLKKAYQARAEVNDSDDEDSDVDGIDNELLDSDEDEIDEEGEVYLESLEEKVKKAGTVAGMNVKSSIEFDDDDEDSDEDYDDCEETSLEAYTTPLDDYDCTVDEYIIFKDLLMNLQTSDPGWYQQLTGHLSEFQKKALNEVINFANQRIAARESKKIELAGGYTFGAKNVPGAFNFGAPVTSPFGKN